MSLCDLASSGHIAVMPSNRARQSALDMFGEGRTITAKGAEAIFKMDKPWGPGSASELCDALGDWDGRKRPRAEPTRWGATSRTYLEDKGVMLEIGRGTTVTFECSTPSGINEGNTQSW